MVIQNSEVSMTSKASYASGMKLTVQSVDQPLINMAGIDIIGVPEKIEEVEGDKEGGEFLSSLNYALNQNGQVKEVDGVDSGVNMAANRQVRFYTLEYLLRLLLMNTIFGEDYDFGQVLDETVSQSSTGSTSTQVLQTTTMTYEYFESQKVDFSSTGTVVTGDGRQIQFNYGFKMSASFEAAYSEKYQAIRQNCIDPLVINLNDCPTSISDQLFYFDLDCDGQEDEIHNLAAGSGFLALDKDGDGIINDGRELFGAMSGDGFGELAIFDSDGNGWIDENDPVFTRLRIMSINENGEKELYGLKQSDVGAIFLGRIETQFKDSDDNNQARGIIRKSGLFLHESDGHAGGVQHVDFAT
ncbi:hypothetical protein [Pseudobutyrivibrio sp.]|uniref:hypothetical protein n=1 Tax=Pseudobutyrivibrio sp. TaxID=2014367 RepID=UPI0025D60EA1|nr:hypothetical protein [Pseudobutyrivibrio sp.]